MKILSNNIYIELSYNNHSKPLAECIVCGKENISQKRIDVVSVFGDNESYCVSEWVKKIWKLK